MIYLQLNAINQPIVILEFLFLLSVATLIGWIIARSVLKGQILSLQNSIDERQVQVKSCMSDINQQKKKGTTSLVGIASKTVYPQIDPLATKPDDLTVIEGIGPKIEEILNIEGIMTYTALADTTPIRLSSILKKAGPRFQIHDPSTWPHQAKLAKFNKWDDLEELKKKLIGGREKML